MKRNDHWVRHGSARKALATRLSWCAAVAAVIGVALLAMRGGHRDPSPVATRSPAGGSRETLQGGPDLVGARETPSAAVAGTVRSSNGRPIEHARVCAVSVNHEPVGSPPAPCSDTTAVGLFSFAGLPAGAYFIRAGAIGHAPGVANGGRPVSLAQGSSKGDLDIVLEPGGAQVSGVVIDATGGTVPQALVRIARTPSGDVLDITSDDSGRFEAFISTGSVAVTAQASGYAPAHTFVIAPASGLELVLTPSASLSGTVTIAGSGSEAGRPLPNVIVRAVPVGSWGFPAHPSSVTGPEGTFTITGLVPGAYGVVAEGDRLRGSNDGPFQVGVAEAVGGANVVVTTARRVVGEVTLRQSGEPCRQGNVVLSQPEKSAAPVPTMMTTITSTGAAVLESVPAGHYSVLVQCNDHVLAEGPRELKVLQDDVTGVKWKVAPGLGLRVRIADQRDRPVAGYTFQLQLPHAQGESTPTMLLTAGGDGTYEYPTILEPGRYVVAPNGNVKGESVTVELRQGMGKVDVALRLAGSGALLVHVHTPSGEPIEGVTVVAVPVAPASPVAPAAGAAVASQASASPVSSGAEQGPSAAERAELAGVLTRAREGRVASRLGKGRYRIAPLEAGRYQVRVDDGVNPLAEVGTGPRYVFDIVNGAEQEAQVTLDRGESIRGQVVDHSGGPLPNVWVTAIHEGAGDPNRRAQTVRSLGREPGAGQRVLTDLDGRFRLFNLARSSDFALRAEQSHGLAAMQRHVRTGEEVTIRFPATGDLKGTLITGGKSGEPTLQASHLESGQTRALLILDKDGSWELTGIASGRVRLFASDDQGRTAQQMVDVPPEGRLDGIRLVLEAPPRLDEAPTATGPTTNQ